MSVIGFAIAAGLLLAGYGLTAIWVAFFAVLTSAADVGGFVANGGHWTPRDGSHDELQRELNGMKLVAVVLVAGGMAELFGLISSRPGTRVVGALLLFAAAGCALWIVIRHHRMQSAESDGDRNGGRIER